MMAEPVVFGRPLQWPYPAEELWRQRLAKHSAPENAVLHPLRRCRYAMGMRISACKGEQGKSGGSALMSALLDYADHWGQSCG